MPIPATKYIWFNGKLVPWEKATVHVLSHALHYGSSVFEGVRAYETPRGPAIFRLKDHTKRLFDSANVIGIADAQNVPAVSEKTRGHVFGECDVRVSFDADVVVVPDPAEIIQAEMTGE